MKKYKVHYSEEACYYKVFEAKSEKEANEKAEQELSDNGDEIAEVILQKMQANPGFSMGPGDTPQGVNSNIPGAQSSSGRPLRQEAGGGAAGTPGDILGGLQ